MEKKQFQKTWKVMMKTFHPVINMNNIKDETMMNCMNTY